MKKINCVSKIILVFICFFSCLGRVENKSSAIPIDTIPKNAIPFEYDEKQRKVPLLKGILNDSIPIDLLFDTGFNANHRILISDSLKCRLGSDFCTVQLTNNFSLQRNLDYWDRDYEFFKYFGQNTACIGFDFFENKIIKISYLQKYIQILDNAEGLEEYICLPLNDQLNGQLNGQYLGIEVEVFVQGKCIKEIVILDTGFNGFVTFDNEILGKYAINVENDWSVTTLTKSLRQHRLHSDSIKVGCVLSGKQTVEFLAEDNHNIYPHSGLLGNAFLENFEIVFDFKESKMYMKPNSVTN